MPYKDPEKQKAVKRLNYLKNREAIKIRTKRNSQARRDAMRITDIHILASKPETRPELWQIRENRENLFKRHEMRIARIPQKIREMMR